MKKIFLVITLWGCWMFSIPASWAAETISSEDSPLAWGEVATPEGIKVLISTVQIQEWMKAQTAEPLKMIAITYGIKNGTENRKIDLAGEMVFRLTDEFGNVYRRLEPPVNFERPVTVPNKNFPSLYPGEQFTASVFFEPPVDASQTLNLRVDAENIGVAEPVVFRLPMVRTSPVPPEEQLEIAIPRKFHRRVKPGDTIPIKVMVSDKLDVPDSIYIIAPFHVYEDQDAQGSYALRVPKDQPPGPLTVVILTRWGLQGQEQTLSKSFTVQVDPSPKPCSEKCAEGHGLAQGTGTGLQLKKF
jgi:hypothetical protein